MSKINPSVLHPSCHDFQKKAKLCVDAFSGEVSDYVETLDGQTASEKSAYVNRAAYFGVVQPTVTALIGAMTRKEFTLEGGDFPQTDFHSPDAFIQANLKNILLGARTVMLVTVENGKSKLVTFDALDVINWHDNFVVIKETQLVQSEDNPFELVPKVGYRELYLEDGLFRSRRWTEKAKDMWVAEELEDLVVQGQLLGFIPVFVANPYDNTWECHTPPLFTQAGQNIQHFKQMCDLTHYAHFMALPTPVLSGDLYTYNTDGGNQITSSVKIGSSKQITHIEKEATFQWVEVSGSSFKMLQDELKNIEERMFISGSRLLTTKRGVESAEALQLRSGSESATLETIVTSFESALRQALTLCSLIDRSNLQVTLNRDFTASVTDPAAIKALLELFVAGVITLEQFQERLMAGEVVKE